MRRTIYLAALALALGASTESFGQGMGGGGGFGGGGGSGGGGFGGGSGGIGGGGSGFGGGGNTFAGGGNNSFTGGTMFTGGTGGNNFTGGGNTGANRPTTGGGRGGAGGGTTFTPSTTGIFAGYYSNPLYPGRPGSTNISNKTVGGFGQPTYGSVNTGGTTGGRGGTANVNVGNNNTNMNRAGSGSPLIVATQVRFAQPTINTGRFQADLQNLVARSSQIRSPGDVRIEYDGTTVVLRGRVADDDERRLVEGMVRMEPGVRDVRNELTVP